MLSSEFRVRESDIEILLQIVCKAEWNWFHWGLLKEHCEISDNAFGDNESNNIDNEWISKFDASSSLLEEKVSCN